jgi:hypothetical protein
MFALAIFNRYLAPYVGAEKNLSEAHYD